MIESIAIILSRYQFAFLYCPILIIGLQVYGSDFKSVVGYVYIIGLSVIAILHLTRHWWVKVVTQLVLKLLMVIGIVIGCLIYRELHLNYWDEHNLTQAMLVSLIGVVAYIVSVQAALTSENKFERLNLLFTCLVFVVNWLISTVYPMVTFLSIILIFAVAMVWLPSQRIEIKKSVKGKFIDRYFLFLFVLDAGLIISDFKVNSMWGAYLSVTAIGCLVGVYLARRHQSKFITLAYCAGIINLLVCIVFPAYILSYAHSVFAGIAMGVCIGKHQFSNVNEVRMKELVNYWSSVLLGLLVGYAFYAHLSMTHWRAVFLVPLIFVIYKNITVISPRSFVSK